MRILGGMLVALALVFAGVVSMRDIVSTDLGVHVRIGERILTEASVPANDTFSHTARGRSAGVDQWAGSILLYLVDGAFGPQGLVLLRVLLVLATFGVLLAASRGKETSEFGFALFVVLGVLAIAPLLLVRPFLFSLFFLAVTAYLFRSYGEGKRDSLWIVLLVFAIWSTLDSRFLYGLALLACFVIGEGAATRFAALSGFEKPMTAGRWRHMALVLVLATAIPLLLAQWMLPGGAPALFATLQYPGHPFFSAVIDEYQPADFVRDRAFFVLFGLALAGVITRSLRRRGFDLANGLALLLFGLLALRTISFIPLFVVICLPLATRESSFWLDRWLRGRSAVGAALSLAGIAGLVWLGLWWRGHDPLHGRGLDERIYPLQAFRFMEEYDIPGPLFHAEQYGGPLLWYFGNTRPVFIDGRLGVFDEAFRREAYFAILGGAPGWEHQLDHFGINTLLLRRGNAAGRDRIGSLARESDAWTLAYFDDVAMMYVRRSAVAGRDDLVNLDMLDPELDITPTSVQQELAMWQTLEAWIPVRKSARAYEIAWKLLAHREDWWQIATTSGLASIVTPETAPFFYGLRGDARFSLRRFVWAGSDWMKSGSLAARSAIGLFSFLDDRSVNDMAIGIEDRPREYARLASLLLNADESVAAADLFREAYAITRSPYDANGIAWALLEAGIAGDEALVLAQEAAAAEPGNGWFRGTLGRALAAAGREAEAEAELVRATQLIPADDYMARSKAHARLALHYSTQGGREADVVKAGIEALLVDAKTWLRTDVVRAVMNAGGESELDRIMEQLCYDLGLGTHMGPEHAHMGHGDMPAELKYRLLTDAGFDPPFPEAPAHGGH
ncbi:MAG: hypothetical protein HKN20_14530 [Gemmatimonadetes bacterium]|nr:hypothetical protein [Gemmatimonadota bacterium]